MYYLHTINHSDMGITLLELKNFN